MGQGVRNKQLKEWAKDEGRRKEVYRKHKGIRPAKWWGTFVDMRGHVQGDANRGSSELVYAHMRQSLFSYTTRDRSNFPPQHLKHVPRNT